MVKRSTKTQSTNSINFLNRSEASFKKSVVDKLKNLPGCWFFSTDEKAIRGIPDIVGLYKGRFFAWELKKSKSEANLKTGRIVLQRYIIDKIIKCGGIGEFVYPENADECFDRLLELNKN